MTPNDAIHTSMKIDLQDSRLAWEGAISLERGDGYIKPWRIPFEQRLLFGRTSVDDMMLSRAGMPAGVRLSFRSDTTVIEGRIAAIIANHFNVPETYAAKLDIVCDGELHSTLDLGAGTSFRIDSLPEREKLIELWLPEYREFRLSALHFSHGASLARHQDARPRWLVYGSSYTQSRGAASPWFTWPAVAARAFDLHHTNLAYGGQCHLDAMVARLMRDYPADILSMEVGVNIHSGATLDARAMRAALIGFVSILRERHPETPLAIMSALYAWERETQRNAVNLTLADTRVIVEEVVDALRATGDRCVHYFNGLDFLGEPEKDLVEDHVHPNAEGYKLLGARFSQRVIASLLPHT
jgi:lysophospholipase L1-like esterase